ncbi:MULTISPECIES: CPBP family glutamic-type intramembrane protease [Staphylococcus]|uniref:CPBP family glutamic-type intramembrane protease n=1 Tax=Staphylococcus TaxID=1279 RepID=UPI000D1AE8D6|nr:MULTISPECIES: CPBP family glutamic-type intramembrane protease [Staphylococcus]PTG46894.1 CPBP family intramembrane metalloprotease [Staphylococcus cohnii]MDQ7110023.1 CPBP family glutamic-type intramembrane protease [Staphylococcus ureilyticus]MDU9349506.1 CPBP family glutamic-type intramembrane protease [Staphylococcus ureilyticus]QQV52278.1 CPBP family intramembrane metalloprotease [Staphylococcus sp. 11-B-312]RIL83202.1 CPBP family intramembrane metalloprotease [Staphylococcus cohnii]
MNRISNALIWFIVSFIVFHIILYIMWGEKQEYWYLYTGIMLIAGISYIFYQRDIESKRLLTSLGIGIITGIVLIIIQLVLAAISSDIQYASLIKELTRTGVYFKWQMLVTLLFVIPCHELYMRTVLQKELLKSNIPMWLSVLITAICSASLFFYLDKMWIVFFVFIVQIVLSLSYYYTRRIATTVIAQIVAVVILLIFHG